MFDRPNNRYKQAFTLAEVLITLAVIGVVAAIAIPGFLNQFNDNQYLGHWKKYVSTLSTTSSQIGKEIDLNIESLGFRESDKFRNLFMPYLNYTKVCDKGDIMGKCWHSSTSDIRNRFGYNNPWLYANNNISGFSGLVLSDGAFVIFMLTNTTFAPYCNGGSYPGGQYCGEIRVDVNGFKGPNKEGVDIFGGKYTNTGKFAPYGAADNYCGSSSCAPYKCNINSTSNSTIGCSAVRLME